MKMKRPNSERERLQAEIAYRNAVMNIAERIMQAVIQRAGLEPNQKDQTALARAALSQAQILLDLTDEIEIPWSEEPPTPTLQFPGRK